VRNVLRRHRAHAGVNSGFPRGDPP
jgi:hypothetical protein